MLQRCSAWGCFLQRRYGFQASVVALDEPGASAKPVKDVFHRVQLRPLQASSVKARTGGERSIGTEHASTSLSRMPLRYSPKIDRHSGKPFGASSDPLPTWYVVEASPCQAVPNVRNSMEDTVATSYLGDIPGIGDRGSRSMTWKPASPRDGYPRSSRAGNHWARCAAFAPAWVRRLRMAGADRFASLDDEFMEYRSQGRGFIRSLSRSAERWAERYLLDQYDGYPRDRLRSACNTG